MPPFQQYLGFEDCGEIMGRSRGLSGIFILEKWVDTGSSNLPGKELLPNLHILLLVRGLTHPLLPAPLPLHPSSCQGLCPSPYPCHPRLLLKERLCLGAEDSESPSSRHPPITGRMHSKSEGWYKCDEFLTFRQYNAVHSDIAVQYNISKQCSTVQYIQAGQYRTFRHLSTVQYIQAVQVQHTHSHTHTHTYTHFTFSGKSGYSPFSGFRFSTNQALILSWMVSLMS